MSLSFGAGSSFLPARLSHPEGRSLKCESVIILPTRRACISCSTPEGEAVLVSRKQSRARVVGLGDVRWVLSLAAMLQRSAAYSFLSNMFSLTLKDLLRIRGRSLSNKNCRFQSWGIGCLLI